MYACAICHKPIDDGAFLPGEQSDLVCMGCFRARCMHEPMPERTIGTAHINKYGVRHRPGMPFKKPRPTYVVISSNVASNKVRKRVTKRNILALKNLPPGSYSVSYRF